jgi:hypothetical protein
MKPLPALKSNPPGPQDRMNRGLLTDSNVPPTSLPAAVPQPSVCVIHRAYPALLILSTTIAGAFCLLYLTKPFIQPTQISPPSLAATTAITPPPPRPDPVTPEAKPSLVPHPDRLPGEPKPTPPAQATNRREIPPPSRASPAYEQTNLRIQHILTAEAPGGYQAKIDLEVPVLYQSRNLRWTANEVAEARKLLVQLSDYQEKSRNLRLEGVELLASWNSLVERSVPTVELRADSPTLPSNQQDAAAGPRPVNPNTKELIQTQPEQK